MIIFSLIILLSCVSLTSCFEKPGKNDLEPALEPYATSSSSILYLHDQVTKYRSSQDAFESIIAKGNVIVDFYANWCGPCKNLGNALQNIAGSLSNVTILKVDVDQFQTIAQQYNVRSIPVLCYFKNGQKVEQEVGSKSATDIKKTVSQVFS